MDGREISIDELPPVQTEELAHDLIEVVANQTKKIAAQDERIKQLEAQLRARDLDVADLAQIATADQRRIDELRAEQDAALWREGVIR